MSFGNLKVLRQLKLVIPPTTTNDLIWDCIVAVLRSSYVPGMHANVRITHLPDAEPELPAPQYPTTFNINMSKLVLSNAGRPLFHIHAHSGQLEKWLKERFLVLDSRGIPVIDYVEVNL